MDRYTISTLQKRKMTEMIKGLIPNAKSVKFKRNGIISVKRGWFKWTKLQLMDLVACIIPVKIKELKEMLDENSAYEPVYNYISYTVIDLLNRRVDTNLIVDFLYKEYCNIKYSLYKTETFCTKALPFESFIAKNMGRITETLVVSHVSTKYFKSNFKEIRTKLYKEKKTINCLITNWLRNLRNKFIPQKKRSYIKILLEVNLK